MLDGRFPRQASRYFLNQSDPNFQAYLSGMSVLRLVYTVDMFMIHTHLSAPFSTKTTFGNNAYRL